MSIGVGTPSRILDLFNAGKLDFTQNLHVLIASRCSMFKRIRTSGRRLLPYWFEEKMHLWYARNAEAPYTDAESKWAEKSLR